MLAGFISAVAVALCSGCADILPGDPGGDGSGGGSDGGPASDGGAGDEDIPRCVEQSGTRLKKVVLDHGGDDADLVRFIDTEFGETECRFQTAADGALRCLPVGSDTAVFTFASAVWADAGCSTLLGQVSYEGTPTSLAVYEPTTASTCYAPGVTHFHQAGTRLPYDGTQTVYEKDFSTGACVGRTAHFNRYYYTMGAEIPAERFVYGLELQSTEGRLRVRSVTGEDGSRSCDHATFRDHERDEACTLQPAEDGAYRCLPAIDFQTTFYTDAGCSAGATAATAQRSACAASNPRYITATPMLCSRGRVLYRRKAVTPGQFYYMSATCTPLEAGYEIFPVGAHVPPEEFVAMADERRDVGGRLQRLDLVGGGARIHRDTWFDPELDSACVFRRTESATWRCVPVSRSGAPVGNAGSIKNGYSDPACTTAVAAVAEDCHGVAPRYVVDSGDSSRVYPVGAKLDQLYQSFGTCMPVQGTWHQVGASLPFDDLVSAYESTP